MSVFDPHFQSEDLDSKILATLERIAESFRVALWNTGKDTGLSPIQIQILLFIRYHAPHLCKISRLAVEFNMTKATVSDAVKTLVQKNLVDKITEIHDNRSQIIRLTESGKQLSEKIDSYATPLLQPLTHFSAIQKEAFYAILLQYLGRLVTQGVLNPQRNCFSCRYLAKEEQNFYCKYFKMPLQSKELRVDCPEHVGM
jgi:DNA-binding MarR family transcriptional regulator